MHSVNAYAPPERRWIDAVNFSSPVDLIGNVPTNPPGTARDCDEYPIVPTEK